MEFLENYFNTKPITFIIKENYELKEDNVYVPRFKLSNFDEIAKIPINEPLKPTLDIFIKAIKYGMVFLVNYKGEKDKHFAGHERVIYPMVIGKSARGKILVRGYHLNGWSVSGNANLRKIWRMFRMDRVLSMTFTGSFFRLPPAGYNMNDKGMRGGIIARADFNEIRKNQQSLLKNGKIQNSEEIDISTKTFVRVKIKRTNTKVDLLEPLENPYINNLKDIANVRISFLKSVYGNVYYALLGALGKPGNTVKLFDEKLGQLGVFKVLDSIAGENLKKIKKIKGNTVFDVVIFDKKI